MFRQISILLIICFSSLSAFAQVEKYTVPVKWERYKATDKEISVLLPKLPVVVESSDVCRERETKKYAAYTDQTVYGFTVTSKTKKKAPDYCAQKKKFDEKSFQDRFSEIKTELKDFTETNFKQNNLTVNKVAGKIATYWLIDDYDNERWFEFQVTQGKEEKEKVKNFVASIEINKKIQGIEIGDGAERTLGDEIVNAGESKDTEATPLIIALKPQPKYTDMARQNEVQGTVTLKVTFWRHGGIGDITPVKGLPYGITEQAVYAAARLVFIPPKKNGVSYSVTKTISYTFTIY